MRRGEREGDEMTTGKGRDVVRKERQRKKNKLGEVMEGGKETGGNNIKSFLSNNIFFLLDSNEVSQKKL